MNYFNRSKMFNNDTSEIRIMLIILKNAEFWLK